MFKRIIEINCYETWIKKLEEFGEVKKSGGHSVIRRLSVFSLFPLVNALFSLTNKNMEGEKKKKRMDNGIIKVLYSIRRFAIPHQLL